MQTVLRSTGGHDKASVFLLTDSQVKDESFLEDIDSLLNSAEIPNLFSGDERVDIMEVGEGAGGGMGWAGEGAGSGMGWDGQGRGMGGGKDGDLITETNFDHYRQSGP